MPRTYVRLTSNLEAAAYRRGVEHANDPTLTVVGITDDEHPTHPFLLTLEDADAEDEGDPNAI